MALQSPLRGGGVLLVVPPGIRIIVLSCRAKAVIRSEVRAVTVTVMVMVGRNEE